MNKEQQLLAKLKEFFSKQTDGWSIISLNLEVTLENNGKTITKVINLDNESFGTQENVVSETSALETDLPKNDLFSETSDMNDSVVQPVKPVGEMNGGFGNKNIFKSSKYSETSSVRPEEMSNLSKTSSAVFNARSDKYSDTSVLGQMGGGMETTDTLRSISELKQRKTRNTSSLDVGIFKKAQSGGSANTNELKKKMMDLGINSSSTSSICE